MQKILKMTVGTDKAKLIKIIMENLEKTGDKKLTLKWKSLVYAHITAEELIDAQKFSGMTQTQIPTAQVINPIPRNYITFNLFNNNDNVRIINSCSSCIQHRIGKNLIKNNFLSPVIYARRQIPMNAIRSYSFGETCIQPMQNLYTGGGLNNFNIINKIRTQSSPVYQGGQNLYETRFMKFK